MNKQKMLLRRLLKKSMRSIQSVRGYLESCGACAFCTLMEGMGYLKSKDYLSFPSGKKIQMDDAVMVYLNDPNNDFASNSMANRRADFYPKAAKELFGVKASIKWGAKFDDAVTELKKGNGVQICLTKPGHWIAVIEYNEKDDELVYMDSWGSRSGLKNGGYHERLTRKDWETNVQKFLISYEA